MSINLQTGDVIAYATPDATPDDGLVIVWNGSATFNTFVDGESADAFTAYDIDTIAGAVEAAQSHLDDIATGMDEVIVPLEDVPGPDLARETMRELGGL